ncbi:CPBP family glutamic-type intramembrane protease [Cucumibacter marinus]|uniref:CPBP family glutamic-type intramembrane protease n=1 Tax=Cucumibacter marinus TaxID=1121252 RepID=UPI000424691B|nr:CPBP family glutamic-type intramembrane protease [Cucumibacter marinus]
MTHFQPVDPMARATGFSRPALLTFAGLIALLALLSATNVFLPAAIPVAQPAELPFPLPVMALIAGISVVVIYGGLGALGLFLAYRNQLPGVWVGQLQTGKDLVQPLLIGIGIGIAFIAVDLAFAPFNGIGRAPHPPFATAIVASVAAGIGEETIFRLLLIPLVFGALWLILRDRVSETHRFWIAAAIAALVFALGHLPAVMLQFGWASPAEVPPLLIVEIILLDGTLSLVAAWLYRRYGILAAMGVHLWTDIVWHVIWGSIPLAA